MTLTVLIPVYKGSQTIYSTLESLRTQSDKEFTVLIGNDTPPENSEERNRVRAIVERFKDLKITYYENEINVGCQGNFQKLVERAQSDLIVFLAHDDVASTQLVEIVRNAFLKHKEIGFLLRPYFWFAENITKPNRQILPPDKTNNTLIPVLEKVSEELFHKVFESIGQISGLAVRREYFNTPFHSDIFPGHMYPIVEIWKKYPGIYVNDYLVAVGTRTSQSKTLSTIYDDSPTLQWLRMFDSEFPKEKYRKQNEWGRDHILTNYIGLVQIKNYGSLKALLREIKLLFKERPRSVYSPQIWFFAIGTILIPRFLLRRLSEWYKKAVISESIGHIPSFDSSHKVQ